MIKKQLVRKADLRKIIYSWALEKDTEIEQSIKLFNKSQTMEDTRKGKLSAVKAVDSFEVAEKDGYESNGESGDSQK